MQKTVSTGSRKDTALTLRIPQDERYFEKNPTLAVAVSGGADSMALLLLTHDWAKKQNGKVIALTVDHQLRKESATEAAQVKKWCAKHTIEHHTLIWKHASRGTQTEARDARYALLTDWCKKHNILHLLTAHHRDDQAETFFFRLARGSGVDGLAGIPAVSVRGGVRLLRPLLDLPKSALENFLREKHQPWVSDPTNTTAKYTRNIVRSHLTPKLNEKAAALAQRFGVVRNHIECRLAETMVRTISIHPEGHAVLSLTEFKKLPPEYGVRTLAALIQTVGGDATPPRSEKLARLYDELCAGKSRTLGGCLFRYQPGKKRFLVRRELETAMPAAFRPPKPLGFGAFLGLNRISS
jgi:tRNA(Ile)-lysidine synthase